MRKGWIRLQIGGRASCHDPFQKNPKADNNVSAFILFYLDFTLYFVTFQFQTSLFRKEMSRSELLTSPNREVYT